MSDFQKGNKIENEGEKSTGHLNSLEVTSALGGEVCNSGGEYSIGWHTSLYVPPWSEAETSDPQCSEDKILFGVFANCDRAAPGIGCIPGDFKMKVAKININLLSQIFPA